VTEEWHARIAHVGPLRVKYERRTRAAMMGRFGGGWNWEVGVQASRRTVIVNLLVASVRFDWRRS